MRSRPKSSSPRLRRVAFDSLVADIRANGLREPITLYDGMVLDGRNRYRACEAARIEPRTPEQISGWLKSGNEPRLRAIGCETIYAFIYRTGQKAEALWRYLTRRHKRRRPRRARPSRDTIKDRASIHDRPKAIESRGEAGHWEGDLIICTPAARARPA